jgi:hypothetical protein
MADSKFIVVFMIMASLLIVMMSSQLCGAFTTATQSGNNAVTTLFDLSTFTLASSSCEIGQVTEIDYSASAQNQSLVNAVGNMSTPQAGATGSFGTSTFIDVIKLIGVSAFGLVGILLGLPVYLFFYLIGLPIMIATTLSVFFFIMYAICWMEFLRGGSL